MLSSSGQVFPGCLSVCFWWSTVHGVNLINNANDRLLRQVNRDVEVLVEGCAVMSGSPELN